ncbi:FtsW/RodA/SpoVE family cell cycle protein, partial [Anaerofustis sp.]|uniref:FtsW/RodA/SpoVE family cell cycle protein n=1 Tax=Anaerofustis sp. TaxID=1872517 RepID=UPI0025BDF965
ITGALIVGMLIIGGMNLKWFIPVAILGVSGIVFMILTTPWRLTRMLTFLDPWADIQGAGWQICQSLMALGSGGLLGRGFGQGKAKLLFMPEPQNDFIFAHIGEEMGLVFSIILIAVYLFLIWRCIVIALNAPDSFSMLFCGGMAGLLGMQVFINIGVATALLPVTGMPLPFVSAGASSLISLMCGMGVVLNISKHCNI